MKFQEELKRYAELIAIHGLNVQPGQLVNISTEIIHRDFTMQIVEACYRQGASYVAVDFSDPRTAAIRVNNSNDKNLEFVPDYLSAKYKELVDTNAANLKLIGSEDPDILADLDPNKVNTVRLHQRLALQYFYDEGIGKSKTHWTVAAAATPKWGENIFSNLKGTEAEEALWKEIFSICRVDTENYLERWEEHNKALQHRAKRFTELKFKELHFTGPETDLIVGLTQKAIFKGGREPSSQGIEFEPNLPTEEVFTTPDFRATRGYVKATRPFMINGKLIRDLKMEFEEGVITKFNASDGEATFKAYIDSDEGGRRLGEVALVGIDSPVYQSGKVFQEILFDENAACHIAVGSAYKFCLQGGGSLSPEEAFTTGCNESSVHTDMMISSEEVDVTAKTYNGQTIELIKAGKWMPEFA